MAGKCELDLNKREKALLRKAADRLHRIGQINSAAFAELRDRGLLRWRLKTADYTLSQKGLRWLAQLEREEG